MLQITLEWPFIWVFGVYLGYMDLKSKSEGQKKLSVIFPPI